jgi:hypothetical protein
MIAASVTAELCGEPTRSDELYRGFAGVKHFGLGDGRAKCFSPATGATTELTAADLRLVAGCRGFASLHEHAHRLGKELGVSSEAVRDRLTTLAGLGFLTSFHELRALLTESNGPGPARIDVVGVPTRDQPDLLSRFLGDWSGAARTAGRSHELVVADDSSRPESRAANRERARSVGAWYAGPDDRDRFATQLARAGADPEAARFALVDDGAHAVATGANRNLLMLHSAGRVLLQADDDTRSRIALGNGPGGGLVLTSDATPTEVWFPADLDGAESAADLAAVHEQLLGRGLGECGEFAAADLNGTEATFFERLRAAGGRVRVTATGVVGDPGVGSPAFYVFLRGPSRERLHRSEATYRAALARSPILRAVTRPTVSDGAVCMALNLGLDLRDPLPPFLPVLRNQDGVFGAAVRSCCPGAFFGHLPAAVVHRPAGDRRFGADALDHAADGPRADHLLQYLIRVHAPRVPSPDCRRNLRILGEALAGLGDLPPNVFRDLIRVASWEWANGLIEQLGGLLKQYDGGPAWWAADVRRMIGRVRAAVTRPDFGAPPEPGPGFERFRVLVARYGRLLRHWPDLLEAAADLRARGVTAARRPGPP